MISHSTLKESQQHLSQEAKLRKSFSEDGYLFLRGVLDGNAVQRVTKDVIRISKRYGFVGKKAISEPIWSRRPTNETDLSLDGPFAKSLGAVKSLAELAQTKKLVRILRKVLACDVYPWKNNQDQVRVIPPGNFMRHLGHVRLPGATPAHQDFYSFRSLDFCTVWIPLMEIDEQVGGLALQSGSHRDGLREHWWRGDLQLGVADTINEATAWRDTGAVVLGGTVQPNGDGHGWLRSDYQMGDVLIFQPLMLHRGLTNTSDRVRLSVDFRFQKKGTVAPWVAHYRAAYTVKFLERSQQCIRQLTSDAQIAGPAWQRIREEGPRRRGLHERAATIIQEVTEANQRIVAGREKEDAT
jgi:ectoine hydroxylase-related dioxygenase (phytanoyl-CoA dioxygenase family)